MTKEEAAAVILNRVPPYFSDTVTLRIKEGTNAPSKRTSLPMVSLECEIVSPEKVKAHDGKEYALDQLSVMMYFPLKSQDKPEATPKMRKDYFEFREKMGVDPVIDDENPPAPTELVGVCFDAILTSEESIVQKKGPDGKYEPVLGPDKKPISKGWQWKQVRTADVLGRTADAPNRPY